jgi:glycosyltransferase involved in cell wall biosynthesis
VISHRTVARSGFDTLLHSAKATLHILRERGADVVHIQNGGNSPFALLLRLFGMRTFVSQDGPDWLRDKWPWYAKAYLWLAQYVTAYGPSSIIFDNVFVKRDFEKKFGRRYHFVPFGADVTYDPAGRAALARLGLEEGRYFLFVGRFIPDKGVHTLVSAFERLAGDGVKLVLVGGSPNPSEYEAGLRATRDPRIVRPGFMYGAEVHALMKHALAYVQPSFVEGLSPVILESAFLGAPIVCSDIVQNRFILNDDALYFPAGDVDALHRRLEQAVADGDALRAVAASAQADVKARFSWARVAQDHLDIFAGLREASDNRVAAPGSTGAAAYE